MDTLAIAPQTYNKGELTQLLDVACDAIRDHLAEKSIKAPKLDYYPRKMLQPAACFVTLEVKNQLQGCIGSTIALRPLILEVHNKAVASAFEDRRFMPLTEDQLNDLTIEIEVLSPLKILHVSSNQELIDYLSDNKVGVMLTDRHTDTILLPSAWRKGLSPQQFVQRLKIKAGWSLNYWSDSLIVKTFTTSAIKEKFHNIRGEYL